ncbi:MAG: autotransporter domain-containing protein [Dialister sp.]|nr:autotransporter domain-containing protein [Dialister sp.]
MKSKKMLAQIAAFSLVFGMTGVVSSWADNTADEVVVKGTTVEQYDPIKIVKVDNTLVDTAADGSLSITGKDVRGIWLTNGAKLTANNVNFNDKGTANEVGLDSSSKLIMKGGSIKVPGVAFTADGGSTATTDGTTIETGVLASNSTIILKNSTTTGVALYAGNEFGQGKVEEGLPVGTLTIDGGKANVKNALVQNKGSMTVTNGAVLDLTGDLSATDEYTQAATGIKKGGEIVVRAWGPNTNTAQVEKKNSDTINKLDKATSFTVNGKSTIKADTIDVTGNSYNGHVDRAELKVSESSTVTANTMNVGKYGSTYFNDSQLTVKQLTMDSSSAEIKGGSFKAGVITVNGTDYEADKGDAQITAPNSKIELNNATFIKYGHADITNSQFTVNGTLKLTSDDAIADKGINFFDSTATLNSVEMKNREMEFTNTATTAKTIKADGTSTIRFMGGSLRSDDINLTNQVHFCAFRDAKLDVKSLTADNSSIYVGRSDDMWDHEVSPAEVNVQQMALKNGSELILAAGTVNADQITMDKSDIDIAGVGTLIANKMTLNNTKLSLSGIQNEVTTLALDADEDIQPLDVTQNGVTVEVKDTLTMNGGTLQVNDGSKLTTNQMKLANGSMVTVDGTNSSYTIKGTDNTVSGDAKIEATHGGSVTLAEGAGIKAEAGTDNKVKTIIKADADSTVDVSKGSLYITNANKVGTVYDVSAAIQSEAENGGTENRGNEFKDIYGASRLVKAFANQNGQYIFKLNNDVISKDSPFSHIVNEAVKNEGKLNDFMNTAFAPGTTDDAQGINALEHAAAIAEMAGVTHGTYGFAQDFSGMIADHKGEGSGIWANYLRQDKKVDGLQVAGRKAKYDVKYNGFLIGSDLISDENSRTGIAFAYADGSHTEKDGVTGKNDTKYYGGDLYHHFTAGGIQYKADIGFIKSDNDLEQTQLGTTIKGSVDGNAFFAGIRAEKEIALGASSLTPYAGLRYYRIHTGDFTDSLGMKHETENANLWNLPVGVEFRHEVKNGSWSLTPVAEIGYNFAMGDKNTKETVSLGNAADTFSFDIGESAFLARLGVEAENSTWTLGGGYRYQKGSDTQSNQWYIQAGYRF